MSILLTKAKTELTLALALVLLTAFLGSNVSNHTQKEYNPYSDKAQEVNAMMQGVLTNPSETNLETAQNNIFYDYAPWAKRQNDSQKEEFLSYLEACNQVIISMSKGQQPDTSKMDELYNNLK